MALSGLAQCSRHGLPVSRAASDQVASPESVFLLAHANGAPNDACSEFPAAIDLGVSSIRIPGHLFSVISDLSCHLQVCKDASSFITDFCKMPYGLRHAILRISHPRIAPSNRPFTCIGQSRWLPAQLGEFGKERNTMNMSTLAHYTIWALLFGESVLALALLVSGISWRLKGQRAGRQAMATGRSYLSRLRGALHAGTGKAALQAKNAIRADASHKTDAISSISRQLVARDLGQDEVDVLISLHIGKLERGAVRLCGLVARTAPLLGLAGTLVGVQMALSAFAQSATEPQLVLEGFATAILTTLAGILVALLCLATSRLLWEPLIRKTMHDLMEMALTLKADLWEVEQLIVKDKMVIRERRRRDRDARIEAMVNASAHKGSGASPGTQETSGDPKGGIALRKKPQRIRKEDHQSDDRSPVLAAETGASAEGRASQRAAAPVKSDCLRSDNTNVDSQQTAHERTIHEEGVSTHVI